jgi:hypothetical protein
MIPPDGSSNMFKETEQANMFTLNGSKDFYKCHAMHAKSYLDEHQIPDPHHCGTVY